MAPPCDSPIQSRRKVGASMHRRLVKSLATMMGAAALVVAPIAFIAPAAQADHVLTPDSFLPGESQYNDEENWAAQLEEDGFVNVECIKVEDEDRAYVLAVVKAGNTDKANEIYEEPEAGHYLSHATSENSHIILCSAELEDDTSTPTPSKPTGPVVETDRVADTGSTTALGVFAAGAMIAGAGALFLSRRRQGAHR